MRPVVSSSYGLPRASRCVVRPVVQAVHGPATGLCVDTGVSAYEPSRLRWRPSIRKACGDREQQALYRT